MSFLEQPCKLARVLGGGPKLNENCPEIHTVCVCSYSACPLCISRASNSVADADKEF